MNLFYLISCLAVAIVRARPEPPAFIGLQQHNQRALPLSAHDVDPIIYQQLPQEHSFANFAIYGAPYPDTLATIMPEKMVDGTEDDSYNAAYRQSFSQQYESGYENGPTETQVHKHIYVHVPPKDFEEEDAIQPRVTHQGGPKQKHYKIVFIKAPATPEMRTPIAPPAPQSEEKTLIYVLHKKPETQPNIVIPTPEPTKPSKPEVYFIKYKNKRYEAPVYGPPPANNEAKSRQLVIDPHTDFMPMNLDQHDIETTTQQPQYPEETMDEEQNSQFVNEESSVDGAAELYHAPTPSNFVSEEVQPTTAETSNQYLPPETTPAPIVVKEMEESFQMPVSTYGTPNRSRFFIKRRK